MAKNKKTAAKREANRSDDEVGNLLYEVLETEIGGVEVYLNARPCAVDPDLRAEWEEYFAQTTEHVTALEGVLVSMGLDPDRDTPGRQVVRHVGKSLVKAIQLAQGSLPAEAAQIVAAECVVHAETKDHANWELIGKLLEAGLVENDELAAAHARIADEEGEHLFHTRGWCRELHAKALGLPARLPPPEETEDVRSEAEAVRVGR